ncbi:MAG TPA: two-component regulator propeller domain-containing protein [Pyrinomonadaceae bacterium]|jgi:signal transduction histidine kinase/ligand-binding sensor domain-containing protein
MKTVGRSQKSVVSRRKTAGHGRRAHPSLKLRALALGLLPVVCCLLPVAARQFNANTTPSTTEKATSAAAELPASNLHQWGAVTLFHGLPSDRVRALAQDAEGSLWFGTDNGLARYDGRRTQSAQLEGLQGARVLALKFDAAGALWVGTDGGAARLSGGALRIIEETRGKSVSAIALVDGEPGRAWLATEQGQLFDCRAQADDTTSVRALPDAPLASADADHPGGLRLTSLAFARDGTLYAGSHSRGVLRVERGQLSEVVSRPRAYFIEALATDDAGELFVGARARAADSGLYAAADVLRPQKVGASLGTVTALARAEDGGLWVATDGQGVWRYAAGRLGAHFTFAGTGGGLRSDHVYTVFVDREGVVWFGTDRGVCRFDPRAPHNEAPGDDAESNFVRTIYQTRAGELLCGTNRGLFVYDRQARAWRALVPLARRTVYALAEDAEGRLLVGTSGGLYVNVSTKRAAPARTAAPADERAEQPRLGEPSESSQPNAQTRQSSNAQPPRAQGDSSSTRADAASAQPAAPRAQADAGPSPRADTASSARAAGQETRERGASSAREDAGGTAREDASASAREGASSPRPESVRALRQFQNAIYLASYGLGVERLDGARRTHVWPGAGADARLREVTALYADGDARLWIGTARAGLFVYERGEVTPATAALAPLAAGAIWGASGSADAALWFATAQGLYLYRAGQLTAVVPNADVRAVVADEPEDTTVKTEAAGQTNTASKTETDAPGAWCATAGGGLLRVRLDPQAGPLVARLDVEQGLASAQAFALLRPPVDESNADRLRSDRSLLVGTSRGLVRYTPGRVAPTLVAGRVLSRRLHAPEELRAGFELPYPQNSLALDVAARSSRTYPEQFQYLFTLRDGAGRELRRRLARDAQFVMENLAPGRYRVEARAFTQDLVASAPLAFEFTVARAPFPWTTTLLAVLLVLALVALTWGAIQNRRIARTSTALAAAHHDLASARLELANEAERERRRIARDLHDQTLADLRSLMLMTDGLPAGPNGSGAHVEPARFRAEIEAVSQEIRRICEDLSPSVLENVGLAAALEFALANAVAHAPPDRRFEYEFACPEDFDERLALKAGERMQLYRIAQEAINNVCRHADARRVSLAVALAADGALALTLADDGRSFDLKEARKGRGLANIRARASLINAHVTWARRPAGGTLFTLRKPAAAQDENDNRTK